MKTFIPTALAIFATAFALTLPSAGPVSAADFPQRLALESQSSRSGLAVERLPLLKRVVGPGREAMAGQVLARFAQSRTRHHDARTLQHRGR